MMILEGDWEALEAEERPHGTARLRLFPRSEHDIFLGVDQQTRQRLLLITVPTAAVAQLLRENPVLPQTKGLSLQIVPAGGDRHDLQVVLTARERREVFNPLIADIAGAVAAERGPVAALRAAVGRFEHWRRLLQSIADTGLGAEARLGLFGELAVLRDHVVPAVGPAAAVSAWRGPAAADQDFQMAACAIEVKTGAGKNPRAVTIASERQLDGRSVKRLLLCHLSVEERHGGSGESLNEIIDSLLRGLGPGPAGLLAALLVTAGYLSEHRHLYDEPRYTVLRTSFWDVAGEFPRIVESDLRPGVGGCSYRISLAGLGPYEVPADRAIGIIKGES